MPCSWQDSVVLHTSVCNTGEPGRFLGCFFPQTGELDGGVTACCRTALPLLLVPPAAVSHRCVFAGRVPSAFSASRGGTTRPRLWSSQAINIGGWLGATGPRHNPTPPLPHSQ